jgi:hypothetical protein
MLTLQPGEQVPQVPLLGVGPALAVRRVVGGEEPVQHRRAAAGELLPDARAGHPGVQRDRRVGVGGDGVGLERPLVPAGAGGEPVPELADHQPPQLGCGQLWRTLILQLHSSRGRTRLIIETERRHFIHDSQRALLPHRAPAGNNRC